MQARRTHRILGLVLLVPLTTWALTGFVFFVKPGYEAAYAGLKVRTYPLEGAWFPPPDPGRLEVRLLRTKLGDHLLVRSTDGWDHLDPTTGRPRDLPDAAAIRQLVNDAIDSDRARYGEIVAVTRSPGKDASASIRTTTGVEIGLDWTTLDLRQSGPDTRRIDALYRVHYLQWTGIHLLDRILAVAGIVLLLALAALGARIALGGPR